MTSANNGSQTIGCKVSACRFNERGTSCRLSRIEVEPCPGCRSHTGRPEDESSCGSFSARDNG